RAKPTAMRNRESDLAHIAGSLEALLSQQEAVQSAIDEVGSITERADALTKIARQFSAPFDLAKEFTANLQPLERIEIKPLQGWGLTTEIPWRSLSETLAASMTP